MNSENSKRKTEIESLDEHVNEEITTIEADIYLLEEENESQKTDIIHLEEDFSDFKVDIEVDLEALTTTIDMLNMAPIGTIVAWTPRPNRDSYDEVSLPNGWIVCDGRIIDAGIWKGKRTPDLNEERRFLRGGSHGNALSPEEDSIRPTTVYTEDYYQGYGNYCPYGGDKVRNTGFSNDGNLDDPYCKAERRVSIGSGSETRPISVSVVWIMKIK